MREQFMGGPTVEPKGSDRSMSDMEIYNQSSFFVKSSRSLLH